MKTVMDLINAWKDEGSRETILLGIEPLGTPESDCVETNKNKFSFDKGVVTVKPRGWSEYSMTALNGRQAKRLARLIDQLS